MAKARPSYHIRNLGHAAEIETARKDVLTILCADPATLTVLMRAYESVSQNRKPIEEAVHVHPDRFAHNREAAETVVRERAHGIVERCRAISGIIPESEPGKERRKANDVQFPSDEFIARAQLLDEMLDIRLPDQLIAAVPQTAAARKHCDQKHADAINAECQPALQKLWQASAAMVETNLKLVDKFIPKRFADRSDHADILQEGVIGLMKAVERWDEKARYRFVTYAQYYIRSYTTRFVQDSASTIRIPIHMHERLDKLQQVETSYIALHGEIPGADAVAQKLDFPVGKIRAMRQITRDDHQFEHPELYANTRGDKSEIANKSYAPERIIDGRKNQQTDAILNQLSEKTAAVLQTLTPREERVLKMRFGIEDGQEQTLDEIGASFMVTRERIRQIESKALRKLRHPSLARHLEPFFDLPKDKPHLSFHQP